MSVKTVVCGWRRIGWKVVLYDINCLNAKHAGVKNYTYININKNTPFKNIIYKTKGIDTIPSPYECIKNVGIGFSDQKYTVSYMKKNRRVQMFFFFFFSKPQHNNILLKS